MILIIAVLAILLLIACVGLHVLNEGVKEAHVVAEDYEQRWFDESKESSKLRNDKHHECERAEVLQEQVFALKQTIADLQAELSERPLPSQAEEELQEQGNFVKRRTMKRATPETYRNVFDLDLNGQRVLEHLTMVFCKEAFVSNDKGGERETCHRLGQQSVINFIVNTINQANNPNYKEQVND